MEIPVPTSGVHGGPGAFPGAHPESIHIKNPHKPSHFLRGGRPSDLRKPMPDLTEQVIPFAERHKKGPTFDKHIIGGGNVVLQGIVKEKMKKIYPKLADQKFPPPPPPDPDLNPWGRKKRK